MEHYRTHSLYYIALCLMLNLSMLAASESDALVNQGWEQWNANRRDLVEQSFLSAIQKDENNIRAYIGLMLLYTLQEQHEKAWTFYRQALDKLDNPYPYIYSTWITSMFRNNPWMEKGGIIERLVLLSKDIKAPPSLRGMASEVLGEYYEKKNNLSKSKEYYDRMHAITDWMLLGAFDNTSACGYDAVFPPETEYNPTAVYSGKHGAPASWFKIDFIRRDRWIDFTRYFAYDDAIFYANSFIYSPIRQKVQIRVGTSGSLKFFLNDRLVLSAQDENNNDLDTYIAATELQKGWNRVLIKCGYSEITSCNFMLRATDLNGNEIPGLKVSTEPQAYSSEINGSIEIINNFAEAFFIDQIKQHPDHYENYFLLAECYLRNDKAAEAEEILRKGSKMLPQCSMFYYSFIEANTRGNKGNENGDIIEKISSLDNKIPVVLIYRYSQFLENEQFDEAEQKIRELETILPESETVYSLYVGLYGKKKQIDKIIAYGKKAYEHYPWSWNFANLNAQIALETNKDFQPAVNIIKDYLKYDYSSTPLLALAKMYLQWGKLALYEKTFKELLELDPASPGYHQALGKTYVEAQQYEKAIEKFKMVIKICPNSSTAWDQLGNCYRIADNINEARQSFRQALAFLPTNYGSRETLREIEGKPQIFSSFQSEDIARLKRTGISAESYPEDEAIYLLDDTKRVVYPEGASEYTREIAVKTFNSRGVDDFKEYYIGYNSYSERLTIEKAVVIKAEDHSEIKADINRNQVVFKSLESGDIIYLKWHVRNYYSGKLSKHFWDEIFFNGYIPKKLVRYSLLVPLELPFRYKLQQADTKPAIDTLQDGLLYTWTMENLPSIQQEEGMPVLDDIGTKLHISSIPAWDYIVQWYFDITRDKTRSSFEIKEQVQELFKEKPNLSENEKIRLVYNYITEKIRYSSVSFRQSSFIPQRARNVLVHKIGDCKDVATLCIAMLKEIGIPAYHVLVNTRNEGKNQFVLPSIAFNHCIVGAQTKAGMKYLDLTAYNYSMESAPFLDQDAFALLIKPDEKEPFYLSDDLFSPKNITRTSFLTINSDNSILIERTSTRIGAPAGYYRNLFRNKGKKETENKIISILTYDNNSIQLKGYEFENLDFPEPVFTYKFSYLANNYITEAGGLKILKVNWSDKLETDQALLYEKRVFPYEYYPGTDTLSEDLTIKIPAGYRAVDLVPSKSITSKFGKYSLTYSVSKGIIQGKRIFINNKKIIYPEEYKEFKKFYNNVLREDEKNITLKKGK
ncbi:MAG: DUF3857 domain-containing protein [Bacteroidetes bacterium]|nr:DUF3857 domain-containing protein [Bacteroidota bacterium]